MFRLPLLDAWIGRQVCSCMLCTVATRFIKSFSKCLVCVGKGAEEGVERIFDDRPVTTQVLPRDKLVGVLYKHVLDNYLDRVEVNYGFEVTPIDFAAGDGTTVVVRYVCCAFVAINLFANGSLSYISSSRQSNQMR